MWLVHLTWLTSVGVGCQLNSLSLRFSWAFSDGDQVPSQQVHHHKSFIMIYWGDLYRSNLPLSMYMKVRVNGFNFGCWSSAVPLPGILSQRVKLTQYSTTPPTQRKDTSTSNGLAFSSCMIPFSLKRNSISNVNSFQMMPIGHLLVLLFYVGRWVCFWCSGYFSIFSEWAPQWLGAS